MRTDRRTNCKFFGNFNSSPAYFSSANSGKAHFCQRERCTKSAISGPWFLQSRETPGVEPHQEAPEQPRPSKSCVQRIQRISAKVPVPVELMMNFGFRTVYNKYFTSHEVQSVAMVVHKWRSMPSVLCEMVVRILKKIEKESGWAVAYGDFYCRSTAPNNLCLFACHSHLRLAVLRGSWNSGTVA